MMDIKEPNSIDMVIGFSENHLSSIVGLTWKTTFKEICWKYDLSADGKLIPPADPSKPDIEFSGEPYLARKDASEALRMIKLQDQPPDTLPLANIRFVFWNGVFKNNKSGNEMKFMGDQADGPYKNDPLALEISNLCINESNAHLSATTYTALAEMFGNNYADYVNAHSIGMTSKKGMAGFTSPHKFENKDVDDATILVKGFIEWFSNNDKAQEAFNRINFFDLIYSINIMGVPDSLIPTQYSYQVLKSGKLNSKSIPKSLAIACVVMQSSKLPDRVDEQIPDSGALFSVTQDDGVLDRSVDPIIAVSPRCFSAFFTKLLRNCYCSPYQNLPLRVVRRPDFQGFFDLIHDEIHPVTEIEEIDVAHNNLISAFTSPEITTHAISYDNHATFTDSTSIKSAWRPLSEGLKISVQILHHFSGYSEFIPASHEDGTGGVYAEHGGYAGTVFIECKDHQYNQGIEVIYDADLEGTILVPAINMPATSMSSVGDQFPNNGTQAAQTLSRCVSPNLQALPGYTIRSKMPFSSEMAAIAIFAVPNVTISEATRDQNNQLNFAMTLRDALRRLKLD